MNIFTNHKACFTLCHNWTSHVSNNQNFWPWRMFRKHKRKPLCAAFYVFPVFITLKCVYFCLYYINDLIGQGCASVYKLTHRNIPEDLWKGLRSHMIWEYVSHVKVARYKVFSCKKLDFWCPTYSLIRVMLNFLTDDVCVLNVLSLQSSFLNCFKKYIYLECLKDVTVIINFLVV